MRWQRPGTVRVRATLGAGLVVGLALVAGGVALVVLLRASLVDNIQNGAELRAEDVVALLAGGTMPGPATLDDEDPSLIQVLDATGAVVASSSNLAGRPPIARLRAEEALTLDQVQVSPVDPDQANDPYRAVARATADGRFLVLVARSLESVHESIAALTDALLIGGPILLLLVGATTWVVAGRTLRPVEDIRREVSRISGSELARRVPRPRGADEVARLAETMNAMLDRLEDTQNRERRFVADASHELRSPIATIRHLLDVAILHPERTRVDVLAPELLAENLRMERLVDDLLLLAGADEHGLALHRRSVDLDDLVLAEAARLRRRGVVRVDTTGVGPGRLDGDVAHLARLVRNLTDNAERHAVSTVELGLVAGPCGLRLTVTDDGAGVPDGDRKRIFDRFTRLDAARSRDAGGAGLGLAIVATVAHAHGGTVGIEEGPGNGARFVVIFPATG